jgi:hypothetical protein
MTEYNIERWDVILVDNHRLPMIYVKPDLDFIEFVRQNNYKVVVKIKGTGLPYDNQLIEGVVDQSAFVPNCRPNFFANTGLYVVTLQSSWSGYPEFGRLGKVIFHAYN